MGCKNSSPLTTSSSCPVTPENGNCEQLHLREPTQPCALCSQSSSQCPAENGSGDPVNVVLGVGVNECVKYSGRVRALISLVLR